MTNATLAISRPPDRGRRDGRRHRRPGQPLDRSRRGARTRGRVRLGQDDGRAERARPRSRRGVRLAAGVVLIGETSMLELDESELREARGKLVSYVPQDPVDRSQPGAAHRSTAARGDGVPRVRGQRRGSPRPHGRGDERGPAAGHAGVPAPLPAPAVRRAAAARRLGDGVRLPPVGDRARRADHRPRREHPGIRARDGARPHPRAPRRRAVRHARSRRRRQPRRPRRRDVRRAHRRAGPDAGDLRRAVASVHPVPHRGRAGHQGRPGIVGLRGRAPSPGKRPVGCAFALRCELATDECHASFPPVTEACARITRCGASGAGEIARAHTHGRASLSTSAATSTRRCRCATSTPATARHEVVHDINLDVGRGECVALVGESGSGKTTLSRSIGGLHREWTGDILLNGEPLRPSSRDRPTAQRLTIQYVFQNPYSSLHPRRSIGESVARPLRIAGAGERRGQPARSPRCSSGCRSPRPMRRTTPTSSPAASASASRSPARSWSGRRCSSATRSPRRSTCSCRPPSIELLVDLQRDLGLSMLFVTHNLPLVRSLAQHVAVMADGKIVEFGETEPRADRARAGCTPSGCSPTRRRSRPPRR